MFLTSRGGSIQGVHWHGEGWVGMIPAVHTCSIPYPYPHWNKTCKRQQGSSANQSSMHFIPELKGPPCR